MSINRIKVIKMSLEQIKPKEILDEWIPAKELRIFRRLYFSRDRLYVIKAPNDRVKFYLTVEIVVLFLVLGALINDNVRLSGFVFGAFIGVICGNIIVGLVFIVLITILVWSLDNKVKNRPPQEILALDGSNYPIDYSDISKIEFNILPKEFLRKNGEITIVTSQGTHILIIQDLYFHDIQRKVQKIKERMQIHSKNRKKLTLKKEKQNISEEKEQD
jgi:hypothetical protein